MNTYITSLSDEQKKNIKFMVKVMNTKGITNTFMQAGILAVVSKESAFVPKEELGYQSTSNDRIRKIFGSRVSSLSEEELTKTKNDPKAFFDLIYGGRYGNAADEGFKYRGRGMNQLTFKGNYVAARKHTNVDIVQFPERLNELEVATDVLIGYFKDNLTTSKARLSEYGMKSMNEATSTSSAVGAAYHANAGWGKSKAAIDEDPTGGLSKAKSRVDALYEFINDGSKSPQSITQSTTQPKSGTVRVSVLNVRSGAGINFDKVRELYEGQIVQIYARQGDWIKISEGEEWVSANYLALN